MSTAENHAKRSHRSHYRSRAWSGSRRSVIRPTAKKSFFARMIQQIRKAFKPVKKEQKPND